MLLILTSKFCRLNCNILRKLNADLGNFKFLSFTLILLTFLSYNLEAQSYGKFIPSEVIEKIEKEVKAIDHSQSSTRIRRSLKKVIRDAEALVEANQESENRFHVYHIIIKLQVQLFAKDHSDKTRTDLFETCAKLSAAPEKYGQYRLDAEMILLDQKISKNNYNVSQVSTELRKTLASHINKPAELKSLLTAVKRCEQYGLLSEKKVYLNRLAERFADNKRAIHFIRKQIGFSNMHAIFSGTFERIDGTKIVFPYDRLGHSTMYVFWSTKNESYEKYLAEIKEQQDLKPLRYEIYSFNLDELDDAGASLLKKIGLKCSVMKLPMGIHNETFMVYASKSPHALFVNEYGRVLYESNAASIAKGHKGKKEKASFTFPKANPSRLHYQVQFQSLINGDFLIQEDYEKNNASSAPMQNIMIEIETSLPDTPYRYRITKSESYTAYVKVEKLCAEFVAQHPNDPDCWKIKKNQLVSLLGIWNHSANPEILEKATALSKQILNDKHSNKAVLVAQYCLAKVKLRESLDSKNKIINHFVNAVDSQFPQEKVWACAAMLALYANEVELYEHYRTLILKSGSQKPHSVYSFLQNRRHQFFIFEGDPATSRTFANRYDRYRERRYVTNNDIKEPFESFIPSIFKKLDGTKVKFPQVSKEDLSLIVFLEPPANGNLMLPSSFYKVPSKASVDEAMMKEAKRIAEKSMRKKRKKNKHSRPIIIPKSSGALLEYLKLVDSHVNKSVKLILVFLSDDLTQLKALNEKYQFPCEVYYAEGGVKHPGVRALDLTFSETSACIYLIQRDGSVAWHSSGYPYAVEPGKLTYQSYLAIRNHLFRCDMEYGYSLLKEGSFKNANTVFSGPYVNPAIAKHVDEWRKNGGRTEWHRWTSSQYFGKSLSHIALGEWESALECIEQAKIEHLVYFRHGTDKPCESEISMHKAHALIYNKLGRSSEARAMHSQASIEATHYSNDLNAHTGNSEAYLQFDKKLGELGLKLLDKKVQ